VLSALKSRLRSVRQPQPQSSSQEVAEFFRDYGRFLEDTKNVSESQDILRRAFHATNGYSLDAASALARNRYEVGRQSLCTPKGERQPCVSQETKSLMPSSPYENGVGGSRHGVSARSDWLSSRGSV